MWCGRDVPSFGNKKFGFFDRYLYVFFCFSALEFSALRDVGRTIEEQIKTQKFKATLWLSEDYPLQLKDQVLPIIDLMALNNAWFKKLRDFITLQVLCNLVSLVLDHR